MLSFYSYLPGNPPNGGIVEEKCLDDGLEVVDEYVIPPDVGELVHENQFELGHTQSRKGTDGYEDGGT
jgi:hypothetical protein